MDRFEKGDSVSLKGVIETRKGVTDSPDPSLTIIESLKAEPFFPPAEELDPPLKKIPNKEIMAMASAIADVAHVDFLANISSLKLEAKLILQNPTVSPELIRSLYRKEGGKWYNKWRHDPPSLRQVKSTWLSLTEPEPYNSNQRIYHPE